MKGDAIRIRPSLSGGNEKQENRPPPDDPSEAAASLAHEINNPLEALLNLLYVIEADVVPTQRSHQYFAMAREEASRISQISHAAMDEFREQAGPQNTNVPELFRSVVDFYRSRFESQGISISTRFCADWSIPGYPRQLWQMFSNLLLNAADATPRGGRMHARAAVVHEWRGRWRHGLRLIVADNGSGIAAKDLPRISNRFFTTKGQGGTGLGLSFVKDAVQKHGGELRVRSSTRPGRSGTVLTIFLPLRERVLKMA